MTVLMSLGMLSCMCGRALRIANRRYFVSAYTCSGVLSSSSPPASGLNLESSFKSTFALSFLDSCGGGGPKSASTFRSMASSSSILLLSSNEGARMSRCSYSRLWMKYSSFSEMLITTSSVRPIVMYLSNLKCSCRSSTTHSRSKKRCTRSRFLSSTAFKGAMKNSFTPPNCTLLAKFCRILASSVRLRRVLADSFVSTSMKACGVTMAGLMKRSKKNPPISGDVWSVVALGNFSLHSSRICRQIQRMPYGTCSTDSISLSRNESAMEPNFLMRGTMMDCTSGWAAASSAVILRLRLHTLPVVDSISLIMASYTFSGLISRTRSGWLVMLPRISVSVALR
mmetsp:Transcript_40504/g.101929  ORF Transcript_40504/g.101929 Transcript_40504/m.101929 type:complete len:340 (+) Transcript_40504:829-1848(+)